MPSVRRIPIVRPCSDFCGADFFGELALISGNKRAVSVRATTFAELFVLTKRDFEAVVRFYPVYEEMFQQKV